MLDLRQRFRGLDARPVPDLERAIDLRARHLASVPGALGPIDAQWMGGPRLRVRPYELVAVAAILVLSIGLAVVVHLARTEAPAKYRPSPPPPTSLSEVCPQTADCRPSAGTYSINRFGPKLTFVLPDGWRLRFATGPGEDLHMERNGNSIVWVGADPIEGRYGGCPAAGGSASSAHTSGSPDELAGGMHRDPALITTSPRRVQLGGLEGLELDAVAPRNSKSSCFGLAIPSWSYPMHQWSVSPGEKARSYFLEVPPTREAARRTIVVGIKAPDADFDAFMRDVEPILASFVFS
jgi:hypothetical protein